MIIYMIEFVFFFQAEDGIRDIGVTGVQTCALPICNEERDQALAPFTPTAQNNDPSAEIEGVQKIDYAGGLHVTPDQQVRSEERRVGKECRSRWSPYH